MLDLVLFVSLGILSGFLSGLLGIGGGALVVPGLLWVFSIMTVPVYHSMAMAAATSLMILVFTSLNAARIHFLRRNILWPVVVRMLPWIAVGVIVGVLLASILSAVILKSVFALFLLIIGFKMALKIQPKPGSSSVNPMLTRWVAILIGLLSGLLGVGGGTISVPYLVHCRVDMVKAVGTTMVVTLFVALLGAIVFALLGPQVPVSWTTGYIYWPAVLCVAPFSIVMTRLGVHCARRLQPNHLRRIFAIILLLLAIRMLWG